MRWTEQKISKLKEVLGKGKTASQIAEIIGGITRNAVIGKAHRLNLSAKIRNKSSVQRNSNNLSGGAQSETIQIGRKSRRSKFKSLLLSKDYESAKNRKLEEWTEETGKYMEHDKHPNERDERVVGRKSLEKFSNRPLHLWN